MTACAQCGHQNPAGSKFCANCGNALGLACPSCGSSYSAGDRFCRECGTPLAAAPELPAPQSPPPVAERRLVSVLFADLVGFTQISESRDPEEVRELLSRYFESCRRLVELYGGTVEKFIGDAVMAVWGTPTAQEDDAERAVRTALDLVAAVSALGDEVGAPELRARAGVLTGEAAVNLGAVGEGMVAGDLVNTAARIQAAASPGSVLVGATTRRASEAAVVYEEAGEHELKGKSEPVPLYRAVRVAAARGGALRSTGLEAPFVGRERELRLVKELFHASAEQSKAQLVSIVGIAGIGKSRLAWEFFKYLDGLAETAWWHRGRCLAYGEGVAYWALAEMVRTRAQIVEGEEREAARTKLRTCLEEHLPDAEERAWVEPRLANLLGLEERVDADRQDLFGAWRLFFERLADENPVIVVFEDLQWADQALLAFIEYLLEWSAGRRIYAVALTRPELMAEHPDFGRSVRNAATIALEPLSNTEMTELLDGYVPGLPPEVKQRVLDRAQGVPLYAVETVRMLLDRGLLVEEGSVYRPTGEIETLEMPESLHALAAARLDGLSPVERQLVQDAAVLGKTFTKAALSALTKHHDDELDRILSGLVRKEVLSLQADPRMPERGQYAFLQELLREVAYETLSLRHRKGRHLAAVEAIQQSVGGSETEVPEVIATHLLAAYRAAPDDPDADEIRIRARDALALAGERSGALAAPEAGQRHLDEAVALSEDDPRAQARMLHQAGTFAFRAGHPADARPRHERAIELYESIGDSEGALTAGIALSDVDVSEGRLDEAAQRFQAALSKLDSDQPNPQLAATLAQLARMQALRGHLSEAAETLERAMGLAEAMQINDVIAQGLISRGLVLIMQGRPIEARMILEGALARARAADLPSVWWRAANNLGELLMDTGEFADAVVIYDEIATQARQRGDHEQLVVGRTTPFRALFHLGRWDEIVARIEETQQLPSSQWARAEIVEAVPMLCERGELEQAEELLAGGHWARDAEQPDVAASYQTAYARLLRSQGRSADALAAAEAAWQSHATLGVGSDRMTRAWLEAAQASFELGDLDHVSALVEALQPFHPAQLGLHLSGQKARVEARLRAARGETIGVEEAFAEAESVFERQALPFNLASTRLEHAEWLLTQERGDDAQLLFADARETFAALGARPWLARLDAQASGERTRVPV